MSCSSKVATDKQEVRITDYITNKQKKISEKHDLFCLSFWIEGRLHSTVTYYHLLNIESLDRLVLAN